MNGNIYKREAKLRAKEKRTRQEKRKNFHRFCLSIAEQWLDQNTRENYFQSQELWTMAQDALIPTKAQQQPAPLCSFRTKQYNSSICPNIDPIIDQHHGLNNCTKPRLRYTQRTWESKTATPIEHLISQLIPLHSIAIILPTSYRRNSCSTTIRRAFTVQQKEIIPTRENKS